MSFVLTPPNTVSTELLCDKELSANGELLLNYLDPALSIVLLDNDDNFNLSEAMNRPDSTDFMVVKKKKLKL